jgi:hypothetical protein
MGFNITKTNFLGLYFRKINFAPLAVKNQRYSNLCPCYVHGNLPSQTFRIYPDPQPG